MPFNTNTLRDAEGAASAHQWITRLCLCKHTLKWPRHLTDCSQAVQLK